MTNQTKTVETLADLSGDCVTFEEGGMGGSAQVKNIPLFLRDPSRFEGYREDARRVIRVLIDGGTKEDLHRINRTGLNAMGINNFLAAMAVEIMDCMYHCNLPKPTPICSYCGDEIENPNDHQRETSHSF